MAELILTGAGIIVLLTYVPYIWQKTFLEHYRDALLELRDNLRGSYFSDDNKLDLEHYKNLRTLFNNHLNLIKTLKLPQVHKMGVLFDRNPTLITFIKAELEEQYKSDVPEVQQEIDRCRMLATNIIFKYLIITSPFYTSYLFAKHLLASIHADKELTSKKNVSDKDVKTTSEPSYSFCKVKVNDSHKKKVERTSQNDQKEQVVTVFLRSFVSIDEIDEISLVNSKVDRPKELVFN